MLIFDTMQSPIYWSITSGQMLWVLKGYFDTGFDKVLTNVNLKHGKSLPKTKLFHVKPCSTLRHLTYKCKYVQVVVAVGVSLGKLMGDQLLVLILMIILINIMGLEHGLSDFVLCPWQWFVSWFNLHSGSVRQACSHCSRNRDGRTSF